MVTYIMRQFHCKVFYQLVPLSVIILLLISQADAAKVELQEQLSGSSIVVVHPSETFYLNVKIDTHGIDVNGYSIYLTFDDRFLAVMDSDPETEGIQPFVQGDFGGGGVVDNDTHSDTPEPGDENGIPFFQLDYTELRLVGSANGEGTVATVGFSVLSSPGPISTTINFDFTPSFVRQTEVSLPDGTTIVPEAIGATISISPYLFLLRDPRGSATITLPPETTFNLNLIANASTAEVNGLSAYLTFDDTYLEVVDADSGTPGIQPFSLGTFIADRRVEILENDTHGDTPDPGDENGIEGFQLDFAVGILDGSVSGEGVAASVTFRTRRIEGGAPVSTAIRVDFDPEHLRDTRFSQPGGDTARPVVERPDAFTVVIIPAILMAGRVLLQRRTDQRASITFEVRPTGATTPLETHQIETAPDGSFVFYTAVPPGVYDVTAKEMRSLRSIARAVNIVPPRVESLTFDNERRDLSPEERRKLRGGDYDGNNRINIADFSGLALFYGRRVVPPGETPPLAPPAPRPHPWYADFNGDGVVNIRDFSILASNYGYSGVRSLSDSSD